MDRTETSPRNRKKKIAAIAAATTMVMGGGVAWALWSASGSGSATATALTAQTITVNAVTGSASLYPGASDGDLSFTLTNPNPYPVQFTSMTAGTVTSGNPSCAASNVTVLPATGLTLNVGANSTSSTLTIPNVVSMASAAPDACQGVTFTIALTLTGSQV